MSDTRAVHPAVIDEIILRRIAIAAATLMPATKIAEEVGLSPYQVRRLMGTPKFREVLKELSDMETGMARLAMRTEVSKLANEALRVIREQLGENSLEAVKIALKIMGLDAVEDKSNGPTTISVVLPGQQAPMKEFTSEAIDVTVQDEENRE